MKNSLYLCYVNTLQETNNQQLSILDFKDESSETIPKGSTLEIVETVNTLTDNAEGKDIVQKNIAFLKYVKKANQMFNNKFDYSDFIYLNAKTKSIISCPIHGKFVQNMDKHTAKNSKGCTKCWNENRPKPIWFKKKEIVSFEVFKKRAEKIYNDRYFYYQNFYKGLSNKTKINCKIHGDFTTVPSSFLKLKEGCSKCAKLSVVKKMTDTYEKFIEQAKEKHNNVYEYLVENKLTYVNKKSIIKIKCKKHGNFNKKAQKHLAGQGCFKCKIEKLVKDNILVGGYSENLFLKKPTLKNKTAYLYLLKINDYYKVGITTKNVKNRIKGLVSKAKSKNEVINVKILKLKKDNLYNCFKKEQEILKENSKERLYKSWSTELLKNIDQDKYF